MNNESIKRGAALLLCVILTPGQAAFAEEKRLGDYIYVPAMQAMSAAGTISLRVEGHAMDTLSGEEKTVAYLPGAEFGVYVFSGSGELTPWANPLYPSEPMRIRTGDGEMRFALPKGTEFYLRQESAPAGYLFDGDVLIPVVDGEIVVHNAMPGQLLVCALDTLGNPVAGVVLEVTGENGERHTLTTDESGEAMLSCELAQRYHIREQALPEGVFAARSVDGGEITDSGVTAAVDRAQRTRVTFEHPAAGSVQLQMTLNVIDENAQVREQPLENVRLEILSDPPVSVKTDAQGQARTSLLEGTYAVRLSYEGDRAVALPVSEGQIIVESGSTTMIELTAGETTGRIELTADARLAGAQTGITLVHEQTGKAYGPYVLDEAGAAVSEALPAGVYRIADVTAPEDIVIGGAQSGDRRAQTAEELPVEVRAGQVTRAALQLLAREKQTFGLAAESLNEQGETVQDAPRDALSLTLVNEQGEAVGTVTAAEAMARIEALSGRYTLRMAEQDAERLGVQPVSRAFTLPSEAETIVFDSTQTRIRIAAVDENGAPAAGAVYRLTDGTGAQFEVVCDEDGLAVSPLLAVGEVTIETVDAPQGHAAADAQRVTAVTGEAVRVQIVHERHGSAVLTARMQSLDEYGAAVYLPLANTPIDLLRKEGENYAEMGMTLTTDEDGCARAQLEAGTYVAVINEQALEPGCSAPQAVMFTVENKKQTEAALTCLYWEGGVRVQLTGGRLTDEELAQVRFELVDTDGNVTGMTIQDGTFYAGALEAGDYVLRQTQMPQEYPLSGERTVHVNGGEVTQASVPLEEYAVLTVSRTGLTFDSAMRTYVVPLTGEYGVYVQQDGEMKPYPNEENQTTLWANVTARDIAAGKLTSARLPASEEGTVYYLHEMSRAEGFAQDETYYEAALHAGETVMVNCAVSSDRGFFTLDTADAKTGEHVPGGLYELVDKRTGETLLAFEMGETAYQNAMAIPVGTYELRQTQAAPGYVLSAPASVEVQVPPYLTQGGSIAQARMPAVKLPQDGTLSLIETMYAVQQQGLTLLTVETGALEGAQTLLLPAMTIEVDAAGSERSDIASVVLSGAGDAAGGKYSARVEYCLDGGGWQPSDARETGVLEGPTAVSLDDVRDDICAVRVTYINQATSREEAGAGFTPGQVTLSVQAGAQGEVQMAARCAFEGTFAYRTAQEQQLQTLACGERADYAFVMRADGPFETVSAGRDGRITGMAFLDENADGILDAGETGRYAGMTVFLEATDGSVISMARTGTDGRYAFEGICGGEYRVRFDAGEGVVFSDGGLQSSHRISGVKDRRTGASGVLRMDGSHTDYVVNAGCIYASEITGRLIERVSLGETEGFDGLNVEMRALDAGPDEEPVVVVTGSTGEFVIGRIQPGDYEISVDMPQGYLCREAENGRIIRTLHLEAGKTCDLGSMELQEQAIIHGAVRVDETGDGMLDGTEKTLSGVRVALLEASEGHTEVVAQTVTDADGAYVFEGLYAGEYSVLFELSESWAFTRYGGGSQVYGAVSQSGTTRTLMLIPGETVTAVDAGVTIPARLTVSVFCDTQYDGQKGTYEQMLEGAAISLIRLEGGKDAEKIAYTTGEDGTVVFEGVSPGEYVLAYQLPGQWRSTKQVEATGSYPVSSVPQSSSAGGRSLPFTLSMGADEKRYIGAMLSGSISGMAFYDDDADAGQDEGETGCSDVLAELLNASGEVVAQAYTGANGSYAFEGLAPGRYQVRFTAQEGCGFSGTERTMARGGVQPSETNVSSTRAITVTGGQETSAVHAGVVRLCSLDGYVWEDRNGNCIPERDEMRLSGVRVYLMDGAGRNILSSTETGAFGEYSFDHLKPGEYRLRVDARKGYVFSGAQQGNALPMETERDGRMYTPSFALLGGAHVENLCFGMLTQGAISGRVWEDNDFDGQTGLEENGLRGANVMLLDENGGEVAVTQTGRSGEFTFDQLMPGRYALRVTLPDGYRFTAEGGQSLAPRTESASVDIDLGELAMGGTISDVRIGALKQASLSGVAWMDRDDDGKRANEEAGLSGVHVLLTMTGGADSGRMLETVTDETGAYRFDGLMPGEAVLTFTLPDGCAFARQATGARRTSSVPMADAQTGSTQTILIAAGDSRTDVDVGAVGVGTVSGAVWEDGLYNGQWDEQEPGVPGALVELVNTATGETAKRAETDADGEFTLDFVRVGEYALRVTLPDGRIFTRSGESVLSDTDACEAQTDAFALAMGESRSDVRVGAIVPAGIEGRVAIDTSGDGTGSEDEPGLEGAVVTAMQGGTVVATAHADETGAFSFDMLRPGTYRLRYVLGDEAFFAVGTPLNMTDPDAAEGETGEVTLAMGQHAQAQTVPVVLAGRIAGRSFEDADVNGAMDAGEAAMSGVLAELLDETGRVLAAAHTGEDGAFAFERLREGTYSVRFTLEDGMLFTDYTGREDDSCVPVPEGSVGVTNAFTLGMGENRESLNVGGIRPGKIGDTVWHDLNGNGLQDYKEPLIPGVQLTLLRVNADGTMTETATTTSDRHGYYAFDALRPGTYVLRLDAKEGDSLTTRFGAPLGEIDSDLDPETGMSDPIALQSGQTLRNIDVGLTDHAE